MNGLEARVRRLEDRMVVGQSNVVPVVQYPLVDGQPFSCTVNDQIHYFGTESELMAFVGGRTIGLMTPQVLSDEDWEQYAAAQQQ